MELIDRKALKNALIPLWNCRSDSEFANKDVWREIENAPTIDAVPVRHGEWGGLSNEDSLVKCSVCGHIRFGSSLLYCKEYVRYCENCGARMDGERREG